MLEITETAVRVVADDTKAAIAATDDALLAGAQLFASVLMGTRNSNLPINVTQPLYKHLATSAARLIEGREELECSIRLMTRIKGESRHAELNIGCPDGFPNMPFMDDETMSGQVETD